MHDDFYKSVKIDVLKEIKIGQIRIVEGNHEVELKDLDVDLSNPKESAFLNSLLQRSENTSASSAKTSAVPQKATGKKLSKFIEPFLTDKKTTNCSECYAIA